MNYVIQNFTNTQLFVILTPRSKLLIFFFNIFKFFFFYKTLSYSYNSKKNIFFYWNYFNFFYKFFFSKQLNILLKKNNIKNITFYNNNLYKSLMYWNYCLFLTHLTKKKNNFYNIHLFFKKKNFNSYFLPIKLININVNLNKKYYQNLFYFFLTFNAFFWIQHTNFLKFSLNFLFFNKNASVYNFYNGFFFNVYNF